MVGIVHLDGVKPIGFFLPIIVCKAYHISTFLVGLSYTNTSFHSKAFCNTHRYPIAAPSLIGLCIFVFRLYDL